MTNLMFHKSGNWVIVHIGPESIQTLIKFPALSQDIDSVQLHFCVDKNIEEAEEVKHIGHGKRRSLGVFEHVQNAHIQTPTAHAKVSLGHLLSIDTFYSVQWVC